MITKVIDKGGDPSSDCRNSYLPAKIKNALPYKYDQTVFCAQNSNTKEATCPGDSGKFCLMINLSKISLMFTYASNLY